MRSESDLRVSRRGVLRAGTGVAAGSLAAGTAAAQEDGENGGDSGGGGTKEVAVGPDGQNVFDPETVQVKPGTTVKWVWEGPGHNVHATDVPGDASWDVQTEVTDPPNEYSYTFEEPTGEYAYQCDPHASLGMKGTVAVTENPTENDGRESVLPDSAKTLGVAAVGTTVSVLGLTYFFMRYGGDYTEGDIEE